MVIPELNKEDIQRAIEQIEVLDYEKASVLEIEDLLKPLFAGLKVSAPSYPPGLYLYRSRICPKPEFLHELTYPRAAYVKRFGRANDIGKPMFYGSVTKNIPFFELNAQVGDTLVISIWRTTKQLLVNHIGFTEEVLKQLDSRRDTTMLPEFALNTTKTKNLNTFVYNYLAAAFSRRIPQNQTYLYKLSIAITNKLINGDLLHGVIYPSMAMAGNSDNIVLKPTYVDNNMEFVSVEYLKVREVEGMKFHFDILDSAVEIIDGRIDWTGKMLGWKLSSGEQVSAASDGSDWRWLYENGQRVIPQPTTVIPTNQSLLERQHAEQFKETVRVAKDVVLSGPHGETKVKCTLHLDFNQETRYLSFYIPEAKDPSAILNTLLVNSSDFLSMDVVNGVEMRNQNTDKLLTNQDLPFSNDVFVFSETSFDDNDLKQKHSKLHIDFTFPSMPDKTGK